MIDFTDQVAIVTGAGRGLGRLYALELARRGEDNGVNRVIGEACAQCDVEVAVVGGRERVQSFGPIEGQEPNSVDVTAPRGLTHQAGGIIVPLLMAPMRGDATTLGMSLLIGRRERT